MEQPFKDDTILARWLSGELTEQELAELKSRDDFPDFERIVAGMNHLHAPAYDQKDALKQLRGKLNGTSSSQTARVVKMSNVWRMATAACILLAVGLFYVWPLGNETIYQTSVGEQRTIDLPDGSKVTLNSVSKIVYNADQWEEYRTLQLEGEGFFEVEKGAAFTVETTLGTVTVLGTSFNIRSRTDVFETACFTGKVRVNDKAAKAIDLLPGNAVRIEAAGSVAHWEFAPGKVPWMQARSEFKGVTLKSVFEEVEHQFGISVEMQKIDSSRKFTGSFSHSNSDKALGMICKPMGLMYLKKDNKIVLMPVRK